MERLQNIVSRVCNQSSGYHPRNMTFFSQLNEEEEEQEGRSLDQALCDTLDQSSLFETRAGQEGENLVTHLKSLLKEGKKKIGISLNHPQRM
jgi:16S rRNA U1498 N3-methylase RsmE